MWEMIQHYLAGWATWEELQTYVQKSAARKKNNSDNGLSDQRNVASPRPLLCGSEPVIRSLQAIQFPPPHPCAAISNSLESVFVHSVRHSKHRAERHCPQATHNDTTSRL